MSPSEPDTHVYIVRCADGSFYTGITRRSVEQRVNEHNSGLTDGYTRSRRPVELVWSQAFQWATDAIAAERQIKGWSSKKKIALINDDWDGLRKAAKKDFGRRETKLGAPAPRYGPPGLLGVREFGIGSLLGHKSNETRMKS